MSSIRGGVEQSRERLIALVLLLQRAWQYGSLTQEEIVRELKIDEFPVTAKGPRKVPAYEGNDGAVRQKFERDKARIRELGFEIETDNKGDGAVGYRIDPSSGYAPLIYFTPTRNASYAWRYGSAASVPRAPSASSTRYRPATGDWNLRCTTRP